MKYVIGFSNHPEATKPGYNIPLGIERWVIGDRMSDGDYKAKFFWDGGADYWWFGDLYTKIFFDDGTTLDFEVGGDDLREFWEEYAKNNGYEPQFYDQQMSFEDSMDI